MRKAITPIQVTILRVPLLLPETQISEEYAKHLKFIAFLNCKLWGKINGMTDPNEWYDGLVKQAQDKTQIRWIAINQEKQFLGTIVLKDENKDDKDFEPYKGWLSSFQVVASLRGEHIGRILAEYFAEEAAKKYKEVHVYSNQKELEKIKSFYNKLGFTTVMENTSTRDGSFRCYGKETLCLQGNSQEILKEVQATREQYYSKETDREGTVRYILKPQKPYVLDQKLSTSNVANLLQLGFEYYGLLNATDKIPEYWKTPYLISLVSFLIVVSASNQEASKFILSVYQACEKGLADIQLADEEKPISKELPLPEPYTLSDLFILAFKYSAIKAVSENISQGHENPCIIGFLVLKDKLSSASAISEEVSDLLKNIDIAVSKKSDETEALVDAKKFETQSLYRLVGGHERLITKLLDRIPFPEKAPVAKPSESALVASGSFSPPPKQTSSSITTMTTTTTATITSP